MQRINKFFIDHKKEHIFTCVTHIGGEEFCIPAVTCIMCHLIEHVLSEPDFARVCPNLQQEQVHSAKKVPHSLGTNNFLVIIEMQVTFLAQVVSCKVK